MKPETDRFKAHEMRFARFYCHDRFAALLILILSLFALGPFSFALIRCFTSLIRAVKWNASVVGSVFMVYGIVGACWKWKHLRVYFLLLLLSNA